MGRKRDRTGIAGFFDDLEGKGAKSVRSVKTEAKIAQPDNQESHAREVVPQPTNAEGSTKKSLTNPQAPTGRPLGRRNGDGPAKVKTTLWLPNDVMNDYRERVWLERCHLGELVERALRDYRERNWGKI